MLNRSNDLGSMKQLPTTFKLSVLGASIAHLLLFSTPSFALSNIDNNELSDIVSTQSQGSNNLSNTASGSDTSTVTSKRPPMNLVGDTMPTPGYVTSRFGSWRNWSSGRRYHKGIDFSPNSGKKVVWFADGVAGKQTSSSLNHQAAIRPNGDVYFYLHMKKEGVTPINKPLKAGDYAGTQSNAGGNYPVHLHLGYSVADPSRVRYIGVAGGTSSSSGSGRAKYSTSIQTGAKGGRSGSLSYQKYITDPTPYLPEDRKIHDHNPTFVPYLGTSIRDQYNVLYNPSPKLPSIGRGPTKQYAKLPVVDGTLSDEQMAALRRNGVEAALWGKDSGYNVDGTLMSYGMMASFISASNGSDWATLPQPAEPIDINNMTPAQMVAAIQQKRFGNEQWEEQITKLSEKGLLTEYLMMVAESNYLAQQNSRISDRIEMLSAGIAQAKLFKFNKKIEAMHMDITAEHIPTIIDADLKSMGYGYGYSANPPKDWADVDKNNLQDLYDYLVNAVIGGESIDNAVDAFNYGTNKTTGKWCSYNGSNSSFASNESARAEDRAINRAHVSETTVNDLILSMRGEGACTNRNERYTAGKIQTIRSTLSNIRNSMGYSTYGNNLYDDGAQTVAVRALLLRTSWRPSIRALLLGTSTNTKAAMKDLAGEWASLGNPYKSGSTNPANWPSNYGGVNVVHPEATTAAWNALVAISEWHKNHPGVKITVNEDLTLDYPGKGVYAQNTEGETSQ